MIKVIFLDIDGVLNSTRSAVAFHGYPMNVEKPHMERFDHVAVALIKKICDDTGAKIVLSSGWSQFKRLDRLSGRCQAASGSPSRKNHYCRNS